MALPPSKDLIRKGLTQNDREAAMRVEAKGSYSMTKPVEDVISKERIVELKAMAVSFAGTIRGLTEDPFEAVTLLQ